MESKKSSNAIHFPAELVALIDTAMEIRGGFSTRAEFVRECVRNASHRVIAHNAETKGKKKGKIGKWP